MLTSCNARSVYVPLQSVGVCKACDSDNVPSGYYCENESVHICPVGYYCPNATTKVICPEGTWCKEGFSSWEDCRATIICDAGSEIQKAGWGLIVCFLFFQIFLCGCTCFIRARNKMAARVMAKAADAFANSAAARLDEDETFDVAAFGALRLTIEFEGLGMRLKVNNKRVLENVTGKFPAGSLVALMGPSGSGKTTFMNALSGRAHYGNIDGKDGTKINGQKGEIADFPRLMGFVPQDDIMFASLSVRNNIYYNAKLRLPAGTPEDKIQMHINKVIKVLGLTEISSSPVGDASKRGISGGQKKRVNIGMELAALPSVIFMDEPTSGLDGATTFELAVQLGKLRKSGILIVCVIHQPRFTVFREFTHLLLLGAGGGQIYCGLQEGMEAYLAELGFRLPERENPADWMIDVACGIEPRYDENGNEDKNWTVDTTPEKLFQKWDELYKGKVAAAKFMPEEDEDALEEVEKDRPTPGVCSQICVFLARETRKWSRSSFLSTTGLLFFTGLILGILMQTIGEFSYKAIISILTAPSNLFYMVLTISSRSIFANERLEFLRDFSSGTSCSAYFFAKMAFSVLDWLLYTTAYTMATYWMMPIPAQTYNQFFRMYFWAAWYHMGLGMMLSLAFPEPTTSLLLCTFTPLMLDLALTGTITPIKDMNRLTKGLSALSCGRWFKIGIYSYEMDKYPAHTLNFTDVKDVFDDYESTIEDGKRAWIMLMILGICMRLWVWLTLYLLQNSEGGGCVSRIVYYVKKSFNDAWSYVENRQVTAGREGEHRQEKLAMADAREEAAGVPPRAALLPNAQMVGAPQMA